MLQNQNKIHFVGPNLHLPLQEDANQAWDDEAAQLEAGEGGANAFDMENLVDRAAHMQR